MATKTGETKQCAACGRDFYVKRSAMNRKRFCSQECNASSRYIERSLRHEGGVVFIRIAHDGTETMVCPCHFELIKNFAWHLNRQRGYVVASSLEEKHLYLHRMILGLTSGEIGDHINRNKLDNRCSNLRKVTKQQNAFNTGSRGSLSGFRGVYFRDGRWLAAVSKDGTLHKIGYFDDPDVAARARDAKAKELFGEHAFLNFPNEVASNY